MGDEDKKKKEDLLEQIDGEIEIEPEIDEEDEEEDLENLNLTTGYDEVADDSVKLYLREIGKIPLLTTDEELDIVYFENYEHLGFTAGAASLSRIIPAMTMYKPYLL